MPRGGVIVPNHGQRSPFLALCRRDGCLRSIGHSQTRRIHETSRASPTQLLLLTSPLGGQQELIPVLGELVLTGLLRDLPLGPCHGGRVPPFSVENKSPVSKNPSSAIVGEPPFGKLCPNLAKPRHVTATQKNRNSRLSLLGWPSAIWVANWVSP